MISTKTNKHIENVSIFTILYVRRIRNIRVLILWHLFYFTIKHVLLVLKQKTRFRYVCIYNSKKMKVFYFSYF